jgi:hypothetical protein
MKKQLFFYALLVPLLIYGQTYESFRTDVYDPVGADQELFGYAIKVSDDGSRILVASRAYDGPSLPINTNTGKVAVYEYNGTDWIKIGGDIIGEQPSDEFGRTIAMNATGSIIAVGAQNGDPNGLSSAGYVKVYQYDGANWVQLGATFEGQTAGRALGSSISLSADGMRIAISAIGANTGRGEVKVYDYNGSAWTQVGSTLSGAVNNDQFGFAIDLNDAGTFLAVGAPFVEANGTPSGQNRGQVKVFEYTTDWTNIFTAAGVVGMNDNFGRAVALSGNKSVLAVGATQGGADSGYVRTYGYSSSSNTYVYFRDVSGENVNDRFGESISLNENGVFMAVGAPQNDAFGSNNGKIYLYKRELQGGVNHWYSRQGEYDDTATSGDGDTVALTSDGNVLFTNTLAENNPNGIPGLIKSYADFSTLSVEASVMDVNVKIYPNPTTGIVYISNVSKNPIHTIAVFDLMGRVCFEENVNSIENVSIDLSNLSAGSYLIKIQSGQSSKTIKVNKR